MSSVAVDFCLLKQKKVSQWTCFEIKSNLVFKKYEMSSDFPLDKYEKGTLIARGGKGHVNG